MRSGICIYAENYGGTLAPAVAELLTAAHMIKEKTGEKISALLIAENCAELVRELEELDFDEIYMVETKTPCLFRDDATSRVAAQMLERVRPSCVLIPASSEARSLFSRVAVIVGAGLTADCTELRVAERADGSSFIVQNKPSFGESVMVSIVTKETGYPQMMTIRPGVYQPRENQPLTAPQVTRFDDVEMPESKIRLVGKREADNCGENISAAEIVVVAGKGALTGENLELVRAFARKVGGVVAGTRPLADEGIVSFENQIGQTGCTVRPKVCVSFGVSGAIQHTEGIKDAKLFIAVNSDKDAAIFGVADYGAVADMAEVLNCALDK